MSRPSLSVEQQVRSLRERTGPRVTDPSYIHLRDLRSAVSASLTGLAFEPGSTVLDLFCGTEPYRDLIGSASYISCDLDRMFGSPTVIGSTSLPFADRSFDLVLMTQALYFVDDDRAMIEELGRVLRPGGSAIITNPHRFRPEKTAIERRYRPGEVAGLFGPEWSSLDTVAVGSVGTGVALRCNGTLASLARRVPMVDPALGAIYGAVNLAALAIESIAIRTGWFTPATEVIHARRGPG